MSIETIASISHRVSIVLYIVGAKEVFIFFNYEVPLRNFSKNIYCHFEFEYDIEKMVGVQEVIHIKKIIQKFEKKCLTPFYKRNGFLNFFRTSLVPSVTYILVIKTS